MCGYETHDGMLSRLEVLAKRNPQLAQMGSIGKSKEGRELAYIKISGDVSRRAILEPMFKVWFGFINFNQYTNFTKAVFSAI
jgi:hypothetical protein